MIFWNKKRISWIGIYFIPFTLLNIIISIIMVAIGFFRSFNLTLIFFIIFELFAVVTIIFGMLFSTFFNKAKSAGKLVNTIWNLSILFKIWVFFYRRCLWSILFDHKFALFCCFSSTWGRHRYSNGCSMVSLASFSMRLFISHRSSKNKQQKRS